MPYAGSLKVSAALVLITLCHSARKSDFVLTDV